MKQDLRNLWARLGVSIQATPAEIDALMSGTPKSKEFALAKIFSEGRIRIEGDSYIPGDVILSYDLKYGTHYGHMEVDLETGKLDGKSIRAATALMRNRNRGDTR